MSKAAGRPRIILITRRTALEVLLEHHGTFGQAEFYLKSRGQEISGLVDAHEQQQACMKQVTQEIPVDQRRVSVDREELDRFIFAHQDVVVIVGQDGLVPNTAKYLTGQLTVGINPDPTRIDGILCPHTVETFPALLDWLGNTDQDTFCVEPRTMALAEREDGQRLLALNEVFIGHSSHQSARYRLVAGNVSERQSSSGVICATGTGATGWVASIILQRSLTEPIPSPIDPQLAWFVREPWPSVITGTSLNFGYVAPGDSLVIVSEMGAGGVIFADGIETDRLEFLEGQQISLTNASHTLNLVMPTSPAQP